jgi:hypothetical protein
MQLVANPASSTNAGSSKQSGGLLSRLLGLGGGRSRVADTHFLPANSTSSFNQHERSTTTTAAAPGTASAVTVVMEPTALKEGNVEPAAPDLGFPKNLEAHYSIGPRLGKGGNGVVHVVSSRETGVEYACKSIVKVNPPQHDSAVRPARRCCSGCILISQTGRPYHPEPQSLAKKNFTDTATRLPIATNAVSLCCRC